MSLEVSPILRRNLRGSSLSDLEPSTVGEAGPRSELGLPLVSVAVVTYNQRRFLDECIRSVLAQDYPNIEIVVADDGSTDGTVDLLHRYDAAHPGKFRLVLSDRNRGITPNSNAAHFACTGKYIAWIGGDDLMLPRKISTQVAFMEAHPECSICYHDLEVFDSDTGRLLHRYSERQHPRMGGIREAIRYSTFNGACSTMVRSSSTPRHGFEPTVTVASDWLYWIDSLAGGGTICYLDAVLGRYRRHAGNVTRRVERGMSQGSIDHFTTCHILWSRYPQLHRDILAVYSDLLFQHRKATPGLALGWLSLRIRPRVGRLWSLLIESLRALVRRLRRRT